MIEPPKKMSLKKKIKEIELSNLQKHVHPEFVAEFKFHPKRKWRFDYAIPGKMIAVEREGGTWMSKSRHTSGIGYNKDMEKYNEAVKLGWEVLRYARIDINKIYEDILFIIAE